MKASKGCRAAIRAWVSMAITILPALPGALPPALAAKPKSQYAQVEIPTLAGAKVQLCEGFAAESLEYYLRLRMPKEYATYVRANEFEASQKESLRELALQRIRDEAAAQFDPSTVYEFVDRLGYLSAYQRSPDGFEVRLPSGSNLQTTYFKGMDGRTKLIDLSELYGLKDLVDAEADAKLPAITLNYAFTPSDSDALRAGADTPGAIFIHIDEARAREIVEESRDSPSRRILADLYVRIEQCERPKPRSNVLTARILGFKLFTARLSKSFLETEPTWKRKSLIMQWRSPDWPQAQQ